MVPTRQRGAHKPLSPPGFGSPTGAKTAPAVPPKCFAPQPGGLPPHSRPRGVADVSSTKHPQTPGKPRPNRAASERVSFVPLVLLGFEGERNRKGQSSMYFNVSSTEEKSRTL